MKNNGMNVSGNIVDVLARKIYKGRIVVSGGVITAIETLADVPDVFILPGLVDAHVHIESSMLVPQHFARIAVKHGTVATVSDPHEIANVLGVKGVEFMLDDARKVPFKFYFGAPSCVPATGFESSGFEINSNEIERLLSRKDLWFLSEMMNFPGVVYDDAEVWNKLAVARKLGKPVDGHAPGLSGRNLEKYIGAGITTDHECVNAKEAIEKIKLGMKLQIREGSAAKNFEILIQLIKQYPADVMLCTDDCHPDDLMEKHILHLIKRGMAKGLDFFDLLRAATYNPITHYDLPVGMLQAGSSADFFIVDSLDHLNVLATYINGEKVYEEGKLFIEPGIIKLTNNFHCKTLTKEDIVLGLKGKTVKVIVAYDGDLYTGMEIIEPKSDNGCIVSDIEKDILKIVVVNRYKQTKPVVGLIKNFGLKKGAIAGSIAHDSHNIIAVGTNDLDIVNSINEIIKLKGGIAAFNGDEKVSLALPVAGLMSDQPAEKVSEIYKQINQKPKEWGSKLHAPFMTLSFMALLVIPELKIGDKGLFDGKQFKLTSLYT